MLTGVVADWDARREAVDIARQAAPGRELFDDTVSICWPTKGWPRRAFSTGS
jgi:hypothetical protein